MSMVISDFILFFVGLAVLIKASDVTVDSAKVVAMSVGVSELVIGLTVTSIGTSIPEIATTTTASLSALAGVAEGSGIAIGNIIGSNMTQITLMLGTAAIFRSLAIQKKALHRDGIMMLFASALAYWVIHDLRVSNVEGVIMSLIYIGYLYSLFRGEDRGKSRVKVGDIHVQVFHLIIGIIGVIIGAKLLVDSSIALAIEFGVPSSIIGLTIVSVGTSLPELAISIAAAVKNLPGLSIGNLIGSNITDPLFSLGIAAAVNPVGIAVDPWIVRFDAPLMIGASVLALYLMRTDWKLTRGEGVLLVGIYVLYVLFNYVVKI